MRQFSGRNRLNNCVSVDYVNDSVVFRPVPNGFTGSWFVFFVGSSLFVSTIYFVLWLLLVLLGVVFDSFMLFALRSFFVLLVLGLFLAFLYSLLFFNGFFADFLFPKVNAFWSSFFNFLFSGKVKDWRVIDSASVFDCMVVIPAFSNVRLEYEAIGDFANCLQRVLVRNHFKDDDGSWFAVFIFSRTPENGFLRVSYD